ncbi:fructose-bisphosphate aldolase class I [Kaistia dalseonensis]|uniref:fructose-bisphosphate aldolase n=1 Tax=Kaistia dalseonensis TaxID=410840 RepID=A0ABU0HA81_9HYPH|nr:class I fructose-bisphosphate aldolase [Kaistia dalseonensis]MCX5496563.1 fructose-bisphosphate aldolase class I [Kaistia dalseonensis]MDQ0439185.1 fructose-bisphosphate aldolase class I [Kaistia dalseonensis]
MTESLQAIARRLVEPGKGLLAADESSSTIKKRFDQIKLISTFDTRRDYREMLFRAKPAMSAYVSGVILYDETIRQSAADGTPLVELIKESGSIPGIKVDSGAKPLAGFPGETITEGLDGLGERLSEYYDLGARFAKWRGVIAIGKGLPTQEAIYANAHALARYAALCQAAGIVPIVEPEVLMDGVESSHTIDVCQAVTTDTLRIVFSELERARVDLTGMILKPNMVVPGKTSGQTVSAQEVAERTVAMFRDVVPASVPGIAFLSGGQTDEQATENLSAINQLPNLPWRITFSFGRALQAAALQAWGGKAENVGAGQIAFLHRCRMNSLAALGQWQPALEREAA